MAKFDRRSLWDDEEDNVDEDGFIISGGGYRIPRQRDYTKTDRAVDDALGISSFVGRFDDSDKDWYRRNKLKYSRQADYSPSRQFRSTFSGPSYIGFAAGLDKEYERKSTATRVLRALTRSANTIVDKTDTAQAEYVVQYSSGEDSNTPAAMLNSDKQRLVFVSPDDLLKTDTTEAEDEVVDALTGFVLLRVQIAQTVAPEVVTEINNTSVATLTTKWLATLADNSALAESGVKHSKATFAAIDPAEFAADVVNMHLAGLLAKSMLVRLARRGVIKDWGGFSPYFIRHAKKFASISEGLKVAEVSLETVVGQLSHNMLVDDDPIQLPDGIDELVAARLGTEVPNDKLIYACRALIEDIRKHMAAAAVAAGKKPETGPVEKQLADMLEDAKKKQASNSHVNANGEEFLRQAAAPFADAAKAVKDLQDKKSKLSAASDGNRVDLKRMAALKKLADALNKILDDVKKAEQKAVDLAAPHLFAEEHKRNMLHKAGDELNGRGNATRAFRDIGEDHAKLADELLDVTAKASTVDIEKFDELLEKFKKFTAQANARVKSRTAAIKKDACDLTDVMKAAIAECREKLQQITAPANMEALRDKLAKSSAHDAIKKDYEKYVDALGRQINDALESAANGQKDMLDGKIAALIKARAPGPMADSVNHVSSSFGNICDRLRHAAVSHYSGVSKAVEDNQRLKRMLDFITHSVNNSTFDEPWEDEEEPEEEDTDTGADSADDGDADESGDGSSTPGASGGKSGGKPGRRGKVLGAGATRALSGSCMTDAECASKMVEGMLSGTESTMEKTFGGDEHMRSMLRNRLASIAARDADGEAVRKLADEAGKKLVEAAAGINPVDGQLFGEKVKVHTKILLGEALGRVNDESRNDPEEEYIAYLDKNDAKPVTLVREEVSKKFRGLQQATVKATIQRNKAVISRIKNALNFQGGKRTTDTYGLLSGDLDEGGLHKLSYDCDHIWTQKTSSRLPDVAVGILVDQSGSMSGSKIENAREICISLAEAVRQITGVRLYIYGHTANNDAGPNGLRQTSMTIYEHYTPKHGSDMSQLGGISAHSSNYDGYAVKDVAKRLALDPAKSKYMFVIADGLPAGCGYGGETAEKHVTSVCQFVRTRLKIGLCAFAVGVSEYSHHNFERQYGKNKVVFVDNVRACLPQIVRFLRNTLQQEKRLVSVTD